MPSICAVAGCCDDVCNEIGNEVDIRTVSGVKSNGSSLDKISSQGEKINVE